MTEKFYDVLDILINLEFVELGNAMRMTRLNKYTLYYIKHHSLLWNMVSQKIQTHSTCETCIKYLQLHKACRECGKLKARHLRTVNGKTVYVCDECCSSTTNTYSQLICRTQILRSIIPRHKTCIWSCQLKIILGGLHLARKGRNNKYWYWAYEWKQPLRGFWSKV